MSVKKVETSQVEIGTQELRKFGLLFGGILTALFGVAIPLLLSHPVPLWPWPIAFAMILFALVLPRALIVIYVPWMKFGAVAGWINTRIILGFLFYVIFTPIGVMIRLSGKDLLKQRYDNTLKSYRVTREICPAIEHMEKPY